jgi:hypothetical protein
VTKEFSGEVAGAVMRGLMDDVGCEMSDVRGLMDDVGCERGEG